MKFAKLFTVNVDGAEHQLVVWVSYDYADERYTMHQLTQVGDDGSVELDMEMKGPEAPLRDLWAAYDQTAAENFFKLPAVCVVLEGLSDG